jgi:hypothetical protein
MPESRTHSLGAGVPPRPSVAMAKPRKRSSTSTTTPSTRPSPLESMYAACGAWERCEPFDAEGQYLEDCRVELAQLRALGVVGEGKGDGQRRHSRKVARLVKRKNGVFDTRRYSDKSPAGEDDGKTAREKEHDVAAFLDWQQRLPETLNLPGKLRESFEVRLAASLIEWFNGRPVSILYSVERRRWRQRYEAMLRDPKWLQKVYGLSRQQAAMFAFWLDGVGQPATAESFGVEVSSVKTQLDRARAKVRAAHFVPLERTLKVGGLALGVA